MIIDFHAHAFPERIAKGTIDKLQGAAKVKASTDGTYQGLQESMKEAGIRASVVLPILTKPSQFETVNQFAASTVGMEGIIPFGSVHPDSEDLEGELKRIKEMGLKGIKVHPVYQNVTIDDPRYVELIRHALRLDLWVVIHAGIDIGYPYMVHALPDNMARMLDRVTYTKGENKIVLSHMGGFDTWDGVEALLLGRDVYMDLSYTLGFIKEKQLLDMIKKHGVERIVFGTDSPWANQKETVRLFEDLPLGKEEKELILYKNAVRMLGLERLFENQTK